MTRHLSIALGAEEPTFSQGIRQLEMAAGLPGADIRLTTQMAQVMRAKLAALGLDPQDTTAGELYNALHERIRQDESRLEGVLGIDQHAAAEDVLARVVQFLNALESPQRCFALKHSVAKRLLKSKPPKNAMKRLGYRSVDSMLKHEPVSHILAAAHIVEAATWHKAFGEQYAKLLPSDFESRSLTLTMPRSKKWDALSLDYVQKARHNLLAFKDIGTVVLLPLPERIDGLAIVTLLLIMNEMNELRAYSSFIKLQQVKPDFGALAWQNSRGGEGIVVQLANQEIDWQTIHRYYARFKDAYSTEIFEPHVQPEDLRWRHAETVMAQLEPTLAFWHETQHLVYLDSEGDAVSCNMLDVALSYCNHLPFKDRILQYMRANLRHEILLRYLNQHNLEEATRLQLSQNLATLPLAE